LYQKCEDNARPMFANMSTHLLPSLYMWLTWNLKLFNKYKQLSHLFLKLQGTILEDLKAKWTRMESVSNQRVCHWWTWANSIATIAPINSAFKAEHWSILIAKAPKKSESEFVNTPPQAALPELVREDISNEMSCYSEKWEE